MSRVRVYFAAGGAMAVALGALAMRGFTVDDALVSIRYAQHVRAGVGWRFDAHGPVTDGVTPLAWPVLLAPLARGAALEVLARARLIGVVCAMGAGALAGDAIAEARAPRGAKVVALALLALCLPVAAWSASGMETPLAMLLATLAVTRPRSAALASGFAASLRPELLPWAVMIAALSTRSPRAAPVPVLTAILLAATPFVGCALVRLAVFGRPAPLAVLAKPSDLGHGVSYALAASLASLAFPFACAPAGMARATPDARRARAIALAALVHLVAVVAAGGDWMPYARLVTPIVPSLLVAGVLATTSTRAGWASLAARSAAALSLGVYLAVVAGPAGARVTLDRESLIASAAPLLVGARRVACVDIGWPTAAAPGASLIDLAGITDPEVAALPGGHTSKRLDLAWLLAKDPDVLLLYVPTRAVEDRLRTSPTFGLHFRRAAFIPLGPRGAGYELFARVRGDR